MKLEVVQSCSATEMIRVDLSVASRFLLNTIFVIIFYCSRYDVKLPGSHQSLPKVSLSEWCRLDKERHRPVKTRRNNYE